MAFKRSAVRSRLAPPKEIKGLADFQPTLFSFRAIESKTIKKAGRNPVPGPAVNPREVWNHLTVSLEPAEKSENRHGFVFAWRLFFVRFMGCFRGCKWGAKR